MAESGERLDVLIARDEKHPEKGKMHACGPETGCGHP